MKTSVAFIIFNRPNATQRVFNAIRQARPPKLLVIADGHRAHKPNELEKCAAARAVVDTVDWPCEVLTNYSDTNLGCRYRIASGLNWVFDTVEEAIILEDDCLPHPSFFPYCEMLLDHYRDDERIVSILSDKTSSSGAISRNIAITTRSTFSLGDGLAGDAHGIVLMKTLQRGQRSKIATCYLMCFSKILGQ